MRNFTLFQTGNASAIFCVCLCFFDWMGNLVLSSLHYAGPGNSLCGNHSCTRRSACCVGPHCHSLECPLVMEEGVALAVAPEINKWVKMYSESRAKRNLVYRYLRFTSFRIMNYFKKILTAGKLGKPGHAGNDGMPGNIG